MRHFLKTPLLLLLLSLSSCTQSESGTLSSKKEISIIPSTSERSYDEVKDKKIHYEDIFSLERYSYYVYFYSLTCSHCISLKEFIITQAIKRGDIYFVEACSEVVIIENVDKTIGLTSVEGLGIKGYPSIIQIEDFTLVKNLAGVPLIKSELTN